MYITSWNAHPRSADAGSEFIFSRYFIERTCESAKFLISLSILLRNNQQGDHSVFVSCWAFLCRYRIGLLAEPTRSRMGKRPAFFVFGHRHSRPGADKKGRRLVRRIAKPAEAAMHPSVHPSTHLSSTAGITNIRQASSRFRDWISSLLPTSSSSHSIYKGLPQCFEATCRFKLLADDTSCSSLGLKLKTSFRISITN